MAFGGLVTVVGVYVGSSTWAPHSLSWAVGGLPETAWEGANHALAWLWAQPLWGVIASGGMMVALLGSFIEA